MPGAVLRVSGTKRSVAKFIELSAWKPLCVYWKGKPRFTASTRLSEVNGFNVNVSDAPGMHLQQQVQDATGFLRRHAAEFRRLKRLKLHGTFDFGVEAKDPGGPAYYRFPNKFILNLSRYGLDLELSYYGARPE